MHFERSLGAPERTPDRALCELSNVLLKDGFRTPETGMVDGDLRLPGGLGPADNAPMTTGGEPMPNWAKSV